MKLIMLVLLLAATGCAEMDGACTELEGKRFSSTVRFYCNAESSDGGHVYDCPAELQFSAGDDDKSNVFWRPTDYGITGTVRCDGDKITADSNVGDHIEGMWVPDSDVVVWDGLEYVHVSP